MNQFDENAAKLADMEKYKKLSNITAESYEQRIGGVETTVVVISYLCQFIDAFICSLGAFLLCYSTTQVLILSIGFGFAVAIILELLKRYFLKLLFRHCVHGWLKSTRYYASFLFCLIFAGIGFVGSWHFSVDGSTEIVHYVRSNMQPPTMRSDSVATHTYDVAIKQKQEDMKRVAHLADGTDWTVTNKTYPAMLAALDLFTHKRDSVVNANQALNTNKQKDYIKKSEQVGSSVGLVSLGTLIILFVSLLFLEYYYKQVVSEKPEWLETVFGKQQKQSEKVRETVFETENKEETVSNVQETPQETEKQVVDISTLAKKARAYYGRSHTAKSKTTRQRNAEKAKEYIKELEGLGCIVTVKDGKLKINK